MAIKEKTTTTTTTAQFYPELVISTFVAVYEQENWENCNNRIHVLPLIDSLLFYFQAPYRCVVSSELKNDVISIPVLTLSRPAYKVRYLHD